MNDTTDPRSTNLQGGRTVLESASPSPLPDPSTHSDDSPSVDQRRSDAGLDRWSAALTLGLALASPQTALLVARLLGPRSWPRLDA